MKKPESEVAAVLKAYDDALSRKDAKAVVAMATSRMRRACDR